MDPAVMAAVVPAVISAAGTVLAAWLRAQRPPRGESRSGDAGAPSPRSGATRPDEHRAVIEADAEAGRELLPGDGR